MSELKGLRPFGELLASLKEPEAPKDFKEMVGVRSLFKTLWNMVPNHQQVLNRNQVIMRWLAHRGDSPDFREHGVAYPYGKGLEALIEKYQPKRQTVSAEFTLAPALAALLPGWSRRLAPFQRRRRAG